MLKTLLLILIPAAGLCQSKNLGSYYELHSAANGKTQELTLHNADSFTYIVQDVMVLKGKYRVSLDSLILAAGSKLPIVFQIKRNKLVAFNGHRQPPEWYLTKVK